MNSVNVTNCKTPRLALSAITKVGTPLFKGARREVIFKYGPSAEAARTSGYIPDRIVILDMLEPPIIFIISILQPRTPFLAIAALILARCLYIFHLCGPSAITLIIVLIFDMSPEHDIIVADAGLDIKAAPVMTAATIAYFIVDLLRLVLRRRS